MIHCYEFYASPVISKPRYFELFFHFPWDFEIAGFNCMSLKSGQFPVAWKEALVLPLLKKPGLDILFKNFRPVSNLPFVSKLTESAVYNQTHGHICMNNLYPANQSSYRKNYSTETALLRVKSDILLNMNKQHVTLLVLLDLSAEYRALQPHKNRITFDGYPDIIRY